MPYECVFECIGYDIREKFIVGLNENYYDGIYYPSLRDTFTIDSILSDRPKSLKNVYDDPLFDMGKRTVEGFYYQYSDVENAYSNLSEVEKQKFEIICLYLDVSRLTDDDIGHYIETRHKSVPLINGFEMIGYDIVETAYCPGISGLTNCYIGKDEKKPKLSIEVFNNNGLLNDLSSAIILRDWLDENAEEHSPFEIWKIWMRM